MSKRSKILKLGLLLSLVVGVFYNVKALALDEAWGPQDRQMYTREVPAEEPVFNSISNNLQIGNEANFVRVREVVPGSSPTTASGNTYTDEVDIEVGKEYEIYVYYHNNARASLGSAGMAQNVSLKIDIPEKVEAGKTAVIKGTINWNKGANTTDWFSVWDTAFLNTDETIYLRYVPDTLKIHNGGTADGMALDANAMFSGGETGKGAKLSHLADAAMWGIIPACNEYAGYVTFNVKVDQPKFYIEKEVLDGEKWVDTIEAKPGDTLHFRIHYYNAGTVTQSGVNFSDNLPKELLFTKEEIEPDGDATKNYKIKAVKTVKVGEGYNAEVLIDGDKFFGDKGVVMGNFDAGDEVIVYYDVKIADEKSFEECSTNIWNKAQVATENGTEYDKVKITVKKDCTPPPKTCETDPTMEGCELPDTGPTEIIIMSTIVVGICVGCFYLWRTNRALKKLQASALAEKDQTIVDEQEPKDEQ